MNPEHDWHDRIDQADKRLQEIEVVSTEFVASCPYGVVQKFEGVMPRIALVATMTAERQVPREISVTLAEVFSHLRSSLDHLMNALCVANGNATAPGGSQFPIFKNEPLFSARDKIGNPKKGGGLYQMRGASQIVQTIIESFQPYHGGTNFANDPLWMVHDFAIVDKHRKPHVTGAILQGASLGIVNMWGVDLFVSHWGVAAGAFKQGTEVGRVDFTVTDPHNYTVQMNTDFSYGVAFSEKGPGRGGLVVPTVNTLIAHLRDIVLPQLEPFV